MGASTIRNIKIENEDGSLVNVQHPLPTDGDSVYVKDIWLEESDVGDFSGVITDLFDNLHSQIVNSEVTTGKELFIHFNRTIVANTIGFGNTGTGNFSNVKIEIVNSGGVASTVIDETGLSTKYTTRTFQLPVTAGFNALRITFDTTDTVSLSNCVILKTRSVVSRGQAVKPDGTVVDLNATAGGNQKFSLEEFDGSLNTAPLPVLSKDFLLQVKLGNVAGHRLVHKYGKNDLITTTPGSVSIGGVYQTPSTNVALEIVSDSVADATGGLGATKVLVEGLRFEGGKLVPHSFEVDMNGITPVLLPVGDEFARTFRAFISESGTYATSTGVSSSGTITVQEVGGGDKWLEIAEFTAGNSAGQSQIALYTTPTDTTSVLFAPVFTIEASKDVDMFFFNRRNADDVTPPYSGARRLGHEWLGLQIPDGTSFVMPVALFSGAVDMGFLASVSVGTARVSAEFWILEIDN